MFHVPVPIVPIPQKCSLFLFLFPPCSHEEPVFYRYFATMCYQRLMQVSLGVVGGVANIKPQLRLNTTRVASRHNEAHSVLRLWKGITLFVLLGPIFFSTDAVAVCGSCMCALCGVCAHRICAPLQLTACLQRCC